MRHRQQVQAFVKSITVQPSETEDFILVPSRLLQSLRDEIDGLRVQLKLPPRQWEPAKAADAVARTTE